MLLIVDKLHKTYGTNEGHLEILQDVSFELAEGETLALTGDSGSGKSTLLHLIGGLDEITRGSVKINNCNVAEMNDVERADLRRRDVGVVFQQFNLIPSLSVADNIAFHAKLADRFDKVWIDHLVSSLGLIDQVAKFPEQLSGGQQQRVAIARTLAARPAVILADEPTGNLDYKSADIVMNLFLTLVQESKTALLLVTHSERIASRLSRRLHLSKGKLA